MPQGSVLGPLFSNINVDCLLFSSNNTDVYYNADDIGLFVYDVGTNNVVARLELDSAHAVKLFSDNYMKLSEDKCHLLPV